MKMRFAALAAALVVSSVGCTAMRPGAACGDVCCDDACDTGCCDLPCHMATSQRAPRASHLLGRCAPGLGMFDCLGWTQKGCGSCVDGCGDGCGLFGGPCGGGGCYGGCPGCNNGCLQNGLHALLDCEGCGGCGDRNYNFAPGPPTGQVAYPYYTTRGPRDFLMANPPSIGPR